MGKASVGEEGEKEGAGAELTMALFPSFRVIQSSPLELMSTL